MGLGDKIRKLFRSNRIDDTLFDELEELLIEGDISAVTAVSLVEALRGDRGIRSEADLTEALTQALSAHMIPISLIPRKEVLNLYLLLGVNGVGKTSTVAKLAKYYHDSINIADPVLSAADTFRAAAIDQLMLHGERLNYRVVHQAPGSDPGAVIYDTIESCQARKNSLILADTAGRMHNKDHLVRELQKIDKIVRKKEISGDYKKLLVVDANTGQNGLRQAETFHEAVGVDAVILTKMDSSAKGGIALNICKDLQIPIAFVCYGESYDAIRAFEAQSFVESLVR